MNSVLMLAILGGAAYLLMKSPASVVASVSTGSQSSPIGYASGAVAQQPALTPPASEVIPATAVLRPPTGTLNYALPIQGSVVPLATDASGQIVVPVVHGGVVSAVPVQTLPIVESLNTAYSYMQYFGMNRTLADLDWWGILNRFSRVPVPDSANSTAMDLNTWWMQYQPYLIGYVKAGMAGLSGWAA